MAKIFKPRRALRSSVKSGSKRTLVLASGELMCVGKTAIGENSRADIYLGDGVSQIQNLQPALFGDTSEEDITITDDASTTATAALGNVTTGATLGSILGSLKRAISLNASAIATLNDDLKAKAVDDTTWYKVYNGNVRVCSGSGSDPKSGYYIFGRVIVLHLIMKMLKNDALTAGAMWVSVKTVNGLFGKSFPLYGYGGSDKFCASAVNRTNSVDGEQYVSNGTYPIPTSYVSYTTNQYYIYCNIVTLHGGLLS